MDTVTKHPAALVAVMKEALSALDFVEEILDKHEEQLGEDGENALGALFEAQACLAAEAYGGLAAQAAADAIRANPFKNGGDQ